MLADAVLCGTACSSTAAVIASISWKDLLRPQVPVVPALTLSLFAPVLEKRLRAFAKDRCPRLPHNRGLSLSQNFLWARLLGPPSQRADTGRLEARRTAWRGTPGRGSGRAPARRCAPPAWRAEGPWRSTPPWPSRCPLTSCPDSTAPAQRNVLLQGACGSKPQ